MSRKNAMPAEKLRNDGVNAESYHAGLSKRRTQIEINWKTDVSRIIVATTAFGMGIDKRDVRFVIHNNLLILGKLLSRNWQRRT